MVASAFARLATRTLVTGVVAGAACVVYGAGYEVRDFRLRRVTVPALAPGQRPLRLLQVSDLHITPGQDAKRAWVRSLADLEPDFVVNTGDSLAHRDGVPEVRDALGPLLDVPGAFVLGSNDYFSPGPKNPLRYLAGGTGDDVRPQDRRTHPDLPWRDLVALMSDRGWVDLTNTSARVTVDGRELALRGVDD